MSRFEDRRKRRKPETPERPREEHGDCCSLRVLAYGQSRTVFASIGNSIEVDQKLNAKVGVDQKVNARAQAFASTDASALASTTPAASSDSDSGSDGDSDSASKSDGDSDVSLKEKKAKDLIAKSDEYSITWNTVNGRAPIVVTIRTGGAVVGEFPCADGSGSLTLSNFRVLETDAVAVKGALDVSVEAVDCCGARDVCHFRLREP